MEREPKEVRGWQASPDTWAKLHQAAASFRQSPTKAEAILWEALRGRKVGAARFRRQHAIDRFLVDFYCSHAQLVVEVDGAVHQRQVEQDRIRQRHLESRGLMVLRFTNDEVLEQLDAVVTRIATALAQRRLSQTGDQCRNDAHGLPLSEIGEGVGG